MSDVSSRMELGLLVLMCIVAAPPLICIFLPIYLVGWVAEKIGKLLGLSLDNV